MPVIHLGLPQQRLIGIAPVLGTPLPGVALKTKAQGIVMRPQCHQRLFQQLGLKAQGRLQQHRLVPVRAVRHVGVEEPVLDRGQRRFARKWPLFGRGLLGARGHARQRLHGLMPEQIPRAEMDAQLPGAADHLNRQDRVAAQLKEVVVEPNLRQVQHVTPDLRQVLFQRVAGGHVLLTVQLGVRAGQSTPIQLAVGRQRHAGQQHQVRRHHVIGQLHLEPGLQRFT